MSDFLLSCSTSAKNLLLGVALGSSTGLLGSTAAGAGSATAFIAGGLLSPPSAAFEFSFF